MTPERAKVLWSQYIAGPGLPADVERELTEALRQDPALRESLLQDAEVDGLLRILERTGTDAEAFSRAFFDCLAAEEDKSRFIRKVESKIDSEGAAAGPARGSRRIARVRLHRRDRRSGPALFVALAAAAALFAIVLVSAVSSPPRARNSTAPASPTDRNPEVAAAPEAPRPPSESRTLPPPEPRTPPPEKPTPPSDPRASDPLRGVKPEEGPRSTPPPAESGVKPAPPPPSDAEQKPGTPEAPKRETTKASVATLERVEGDARLVTGDSRTPVTAKTDVLEGQGVETGAGSSLAAVSFPDKSRVTLTSATEVGRIAIGSAGKRIDLARGALEAEVQRQPIGRPMVIATPHAEATVLGTTLRIKVEPDRTRLEVEEGRVQLKALHNSKVIIVTTGHYAVAGPGTDLAALPLPIDEILLLPGQGSRMGTEWQLVDDPKASTRTALEVAAELPRSQRGLTGDVLRKIPSYVTFRFRANANRDYSVWVRGLALPTKGPPALGDAVLVEIPACRIAQTNIQSSGGPQSGEFNGYSSFPGYWWLGGYFPGDAPPVTVNFSREGDQTLKLYAWEGPIRIDAIWISATRKTRPGNGETGPEK
jgi:ferric-dicitrate binding protein FerR (iron transport regulator)